MFPRHLERVDWAPNRVRPPDLTTWPFTIPAVAQLIREGGLEIPPGVTFLVGENGSGKSSFRSVSSYEQLNLVLQWRSFLTEPKRYLRHLLDQRDSSADEGS